MANPMWLDSTHYFLESAGTGKDHIGRVYNVVETFQPLSTSFGSRTVYRTDNMKLMLLWWSRRIEASRLQAGC